MALRWQNKSLLFLNNFLIRLLNYLEIYWSYPRKEDNEMDYILSTKELSKQYGHSKALDGLNMHVPKGSIYGFVGKNGAGKTTLIRLICGLQQPTSGSFQLYGRENCDSEI